MTSEPIHVALGAGPRTCTTEDLACVGITLHLEGGVLEVRFEADPDGAERWVPAPDGYPLDDAHDWIECRGCYFVPMATDS